MIVLEITENVVLDVETRAHAALDDVRARGFNNCIDDFGTGYSSLRYLQQFKIDSARQRLPAEMAAHYPSILGQAARGA